MNKILIVILIVSLFFIEGCTIIGYSLGKGIKIKNSLEMEKIESIEVDSWLTISMKNDEVIKGQFISCTNDTLFVTFQADRNLNAPISNSQFLSISNDNGLYIIPLDQIRDIQIRKADRRGIGALVGFVIDLISFLLVLIINFKLPIFFE